MGQIGRIFARFLPAEDSAWAALLKGTITAWKLTKGVLVVGGLVIIYKAALVIQKAYQSIPAMILTGVQKAVAYFLPLFGELLRQSLTYLWQPVLVYLVIALLTKSKLWRRFWCLVGCAVFFLMFVSALETVTWKQYHLLPLLLVQGYLFSLWVVPRELWNVIGLLVSSVLGLIIIILPDLPTAFDDFGMFGAILAFFLGYLNALASLFQRFARWL